MPINSLITLDVIFQQCYDLRHLDPTNNEPGFLTCFQGIYVGENYFPTLDDLAATVVRIWGSGITKQEFTDAMSNFKKEDGTQAFDNDSILNLATTYFTVVTQHVDHPDLLTTNYTWAYGFQIVPVGVIGVNGVLTKIIANTDLTDQGWGGTYGSDWRITFRRNGNDFFTAQFPVNNPNHYNPQYLRDILYDLGENGPQLQVNDEIWLGVAGWYPGHQASIVNTSFDVYIRQT